MPISWRDCDEGNVTTTIGDVAYIVCIGTHRCDDNYIQLNIMGNKRRFYIEKEWLEERLAEHKSARQMAELIGCSAATIYDAIARYGLKVAFQWEARCDIEPDREWFEARAGMSLAKMAGELGCSKYAVWIRGFQLGAFQSRWDDLPLEFWRERQHLTTTEISKELECSRSIVGVLRDRAGYQFCRTTDPDEKWWGRRAPRSCPCTQYDSTECMRRAMADLPVLCEI